MLFRYIWGRWCYLRSWFRLSVIYVHHGFYDDTIVSFWWNWWQKSSLQPPCQNIYVGTHYFCTTKTQSNQSIWQWSIKRRVVLVPSAIHMWGIFTPAASSGQNGQTPGDNIRASVQLFVARGWRMLFGATSYVMTSISQAMVRMLSFISFVVILKLLQKVQSHLTMKGLSHKPIQLQFWR